MLQQNSHRKPCLNWFLSRPTFAFNTWQIQIIDPNLLSLLIEMVVYLNAAWGAKEVQDWVSGEGPEVGAISR